MAGQDNEDKIVELLKQAYPPAAASPEFKENLRRRVSSEAVAPSASVTQALWQRPLIWVPVVAAAIVASALLIYFVLANSTPPSVITNEATNVQTTSATLNGNLDSLGTAGSADVSFEWGITTDYGNETSNQSKADTGSFAVELSGLSANTTYHFRAKAVGEGTTYGQDEQFTTSTMPPSVITNDASSIGIDSVRLNGDLTSLGTSGDVSVSFEWGIDSSYGNETTPESKSLAGTWSAGLTGLRSNTTYHFRAKATGHGTAYGADGQFTTGTTPPSVTTNNASNIGTNSARLNGALASIGTAGNATVSFVWGTAPGGPYTNETSGQVMTGTGTYYFDLSNLRPGITYYFRGKAVGDGAAYGDERSFTTPTIPPAVGTSQAGSLGINSARLNGYLASLGTADSVTVSFEWGLTTDYGNETTPVCMTAIGSFDASLIGLSPKTTYHFRAKTIGDGTVYGADMMFTTLPISPSVTTKSAGNIKPTSSRLNGDLSSLGTAENVSVSFEWGLTTDYGNETTPVCMTAIGSFDASLTGLSPKTTYHFRAKAIGDGTVYGADMTFTTCSHPTPQKTWYLSGDASDSTRVMYEGDTSKPAATIPIGLGASSYSQIWTANQPCMADTAYPADNWTVQLRLSHIKSSHTMKVEIGTWISNAFSPYGTYTFAGQGNDNSYVYTYIAGIPVDSFVVPSGGYVATRVTISSFHLMYVHVGGAESYVMSPSYPEPTGPSVTTGEPMSVEQTTAVLNGYLDSLGTSSEVAVSFEWGTTTEYGNQIDVGLMTSAGDFTVILTGLTPGTTYHFRAKVVGDGINYGIDVAFTTQDGSIPSHLPI